MIGRGVGWPVFEAQGDAEMREAVGEVGGSVERIDVPAKLAGHALAGSLFTVDAVLGEGFGQARADEFFDGAVGHGDQIDVAFILGFDALGKELAEARARFTGNG